MERLIGWSREFRLWHYSVSYSQLLIRSVNIERERTRIDVLFSNVRRILLSHEYAALVIDQLGVGDSGREVVEGHEEWQNVFLINGGPDFIVASHCKWHEDVGDARSPSHFGPLRRTD
ncbi:hypothetical protein [Actinomadura mexicana]|uniref:hypothetical protein n=1 Tax=Actinomadura mexicana TaxID=134959 RepID=UPI001178B588|nr:hypothetical protein [Actinomadura mexicana]